MLSHHPNSKQPIFSGVDVSTFAAIIRENAASTPFLRITTAAPWQLFRGDSAESIDLSEPFLSGAGSGDFPLDGDKRRLSYFQLIAAEGSGILAERQLPMSGGFNFRDLGGLRTQDGRYVRWGKLIRADEMYRLTSDDLDYLAALPLTTAVDFRSQMEADHAPDRLPSSIRATHHLAIDAGNQSKLQTMQDIEEHELADFMSEMYRRFITDDAFVVQYRTFFEILSQTDNTSTLFHCSAGKDRTGTAAALLLLALGVDEATIMDDYLASNRYLAQKYDKLIAQYPILKVVLNVQEEFLQAAFDQIRHNHTSPENYLKQVLNVDIEVLKKIYLYD